MGFVLGAESTFLQCTLVEMGPSYLNKSVDHFRYTSRWLANHPISHHQEQKVLFDGVISE